MSQPAFARSGFAALIAGLASPWTWRMAWRDTRSSRRRLFVFSLSIVLGVAALVAIDSLNRNLHDAIEDQAKSLLGADLSIVSRSPFTPEQEAFFHSLGGEQSRETSFSSMMYQPRTGAARLVQVRALAGGFPFYGNLETTPAPAANQFRASGGALVEGSLATQFGLTTGEEIKLGDLKTAVAGSLVKVPGETFAFATIAPRVYIPMNLITNSSMLKKGSLVRYRVYFRFPAGTDVTAMMNTAKAQLEKFRLSHETVEKRKADLGESLTNLYRFLNLSGFIALLLGGVGIASAIQVHVREKLKSVAILRCLGSSVGQTFAIYLVQAVGLGFVGVILGAMFGLLLQLALPHVAAGFIPFPVAFTVHWLGVARAMALGLAICSLFALLPLLAVRLVTPLAVLRGAAGTATGRDPWRALVGLAIAAGVTAFAVSQSDKWLHGIGFAAALASAFGVLLVVAKLITWAARRALRPAWPYVLRQGLANLYRPQNRTVLLMVALGLGTFLVLTLFLTHAAILKEMSPERAGSRPNAILFDIQADQEAGVAALVRSQGLPVIDSSPVVTMRLQSIKGRPVDDLLKDKSKNIPDWLLRREYRSTYRDRLLDSETLVGGVWQGRVETNATVVPVSLEDGIARDMQVGLGDEIIFDVQGIPLTTKITSLRKVDWRRVQAGFFVVFPRGVLESAPNFIILTTRVGSNADTARLQQAVAQAFPNVSSIDLNLVLQTLDGIIAKISFALRCMALFTVITGVLVLAGAVLTGRYQRVQESILLRTLGASRAQVLQILFAEYLLLGIFASLTGVLLANGASWGLAKFMFKVPFVPSVWPILIATLAVATLTVATGLLTSLGITRQPPLEILRAEG